MKHHKWKDIDNFANLMRSVKKHFDMFAEGKQSYKVCYNGKIKLHGTNAGIVFTKDGPYAQGRTRVLTPEDDNFGFARWVENTVRPNWEEIPDWHKDLLDGKIVHGEWAGPGIQKDCALTGLNSKKFFVFAVQTNHLDEEVTSRELVIEPSHIEDLLHPFIGVDFYVLPWFYTLDWELDLFNVEQVTHFTKTVSDDVEAIGETDPYIQMVFGVKGKGEGLVFYDRDSTNDRLIFKAKCEEHRTTKTKAAVQVNPEKMHENSEFAKSLVTNARLEQGFDVCFHDPLDPPTMQNIPIFLKWVATDVQKECQAEMEANGKDWKTIAKYVNNVAVSFFREKIESDAIKGLAA